MAEEPAAIGGWASYFGWPFWRNNVPSYDPPNHLSHAPRHRSASGDSQANRRPQGSDNVRDGTNFIRESEDEAYSRYLSRSLPREASRDRSQSSTPHEQGRCDDCDGFQFVSYCNACKLNFCEACWSKQALHRKKILGQGVDLHEKTNGADAIKIEKVLSPPNSSEALTSLHEADEQTAWFGIERPDGHSPMFHDYGRYAELLTQSQDVWFSTMISQDSQSNHKDGRTPSLVSLVGQTGAGKSSLIKLMIDLNSTQDQEFCSPVVGASGETNPTSENVHLYADPVTTISDNPIFFADCEGLQGGEREPLGAKFRRNRKKFRNPDPTPLPVSERKLEWAEEKSYSSREYAVTHLYPRLLYTFSDVIVFVLRNPRVVENVLEQLVSWAAAALETSSNQPILPHAIIVLNASENDIDASEWDLDNATTKILESLSRIVFKNTVFKKYAQFWRERKKQIETVEQLMLSYYSSIRVVRIPQKGRPQLIKAQVTKLYTEVSFRCSQARQRKADLRMLLDAEELQSYLQCAFDHFAISLDKPFDFVEASFSNSPIPLDFGGNILKLAINLMNVWENEADIQFLLQELSYMVASCIMLDSARQKVRGTAADIFPLYLPHLDAACENFCEKHWPCEYVDGGRRCVNVQSGHGSKGHQLKDGTVIAVGEYFTRISFEQLLEEFRCNSFYRLQELLTRLKERTPPGGDETEIAATIHRDDVMAWFYRHVSRDGRSERYNSHSVCFCCLSEPPQHPLPCGHVLCTSCIKTYGEQRSKTEIEIRGCPLDVQTTQAFQVWRVHMKPEAAGVRILTLDGGGIRGIVELETLRHIEAAMGGKLPIQSFFDLVIGTSTGGLIALGLVTQNWSVQQCITQFESLCDKAFTPRKGSDLPLGVGWFIENHHHSKFETAPLKEALQSAFSHEQYLFGGRRLTQHWSSATKVAVTTTLASKSAVLLSNYNRRCDEKLPYQFQRPEGIETELKTWEAARATSAAPRIFKPFHHEPSKHIFMDGAIYYNNPVSIADREWKLIWGSEPCEYPDVLLSIGTAHNSHLTRKVTNSGSSFMLKRGLVNHGKSLLKIAKDHIDNTLDCEQTWNDYLLSLPTSIPTGRFHRLNVGLMKDPPALDDVHSMEGLQKEVVGLLAGNSYQHRSQQIAMRLVASSFYFDVDHIQQYTQNAATITGRVYCRLIEGSGEVKELGKLIRDKSSWGQNPCFGIRDIGSSDDKRIAYGKKHDITPDVMAQMIKQGRFFMRKIEIELKNKLAETEICLCLDEHENYPISGFPRRLIRDEKIATRPLHPLAVNTRRWAGRSNSQQMSRKSWKPPPKHMASRTHTISNYRNDNHKLGHATEDELQKSTAYYEGKALTWWKRRRERKPAVPPKPLELPELDTYTTSDYPVVKHRRVSELDGREIQIPYSQEIPIPYPIAPIPPGPVELEQPPAAPDSQPPIQFWRALGGNNNGDSYRENQPFLMVSPGLRRKGARREASLEDKRARIPGSWGSENKLAPISGSWESENELSRIPGSWVSEDE